jgi:uncharacterized protein YndB with AHSA1/START domain
MADEKSKEKIEGSVDFDGSRSSCVWWAKDEHVDLELGLGRGGAARHRKRTKRGTMVANIDPLDVLSDRELVIGRVFDAPRELVFRAFTDPRCLVRWWAPKGCGTPFCRVDLRAGGVFHYCMRIDGERDGWGIGVFREVIVPERIVYTDTFADPHGAPISPAHYGMKAGQPAETTVSVAFADQRGRTLVTLRQTIPPTVGNRASMEQGWGEMLNKLAAELSGRQAR